MKRQILPAPLRLQRTHSQVELVWLLLELARTQHFCFRGNFDTFGHILKISPETEIVHFCFCFPFWKLTHDSWQFGYCSPVNSCSETEQPALEFGALKVSKLPCMDLGPQVIWFTGQLDAQAVGFVQPRKPASPGVWKPWGSWLQGIWPDEAATYRHGDWVPVQLSRWLGRKPIKVLLESLLGLTNRQLYNTLCVWIGLLWHTRFRSSFAHQSSEGGAEYMLFIYISHGAKSISGNLLNAASQGDESGKGGPGKGSGATAEKMHWSLDNFLTQWCIPPGATQLWV